MGMEKTYTTRLCEWLSALKYEDIPQDVIEQGKRMTLHCIAASLGAAPIAQTQKAIDMMTEKGGVEEATVWRSKGQKVPASEAAFANGSIADIMDWEDCTWTGHAAAGDVPAALAVCQKYRLSGKEYLLALITAQEGYQRIAMYAQPTKSYLATGRGWGLVSWQIYASCIAAAKAMKLDADKMEQAMGAALYQVIVPCNKHSEGSGKSDIYHYSHGWCARNGVVAAEIAELGFDNLYGAFDGQNGLWHKVSDQADFEWLVKDLGTKWYINETYLKHWPANMWVQTPLEALDALMKEHPFTADDVVEIYSEPKMEMICGDYFASTKSPLDAQFSIPYCLSAYILDPEHRMGAHWFSPEMRNSAAIAELSKRYTYGGGPVIPFDNFDIFKTGSFPEITLRITLKDGTVLTKTMRYPKGHPRNNFTNAEEYDHFRMVCSPYMPAERIEKIVAAVDGLDALSDINELAELLVID